MKGRATTTTYRSSSATRSEEDDMPADRFPIEAGHVLMFARSIGDTNPLYTDPAAAAEAGFDGVLAPPTFVQAGAQFTEGYPLRPQPGKVWFGSGSTPSGLSKAPPPGRADGAGGAGAGASGSRGGGGAGRGGGGTGLHAEQRYEYHRPVVAGDVLSATTRPGRTWTREGRRGGNLRFAEQVTEYRDQHGELVVTATSVAVATEKVVEQEEGS
jgi:acyl dehydratase